MNYLTINSDRICMISIYFVWVKIFINNLHFVRYSINKIREDNMFSMTLLLTLCIDGTCNDINVLQDVLVPEPYCNVVGIGDKTVQRFVNDLGGQIGDTAIDLVLYHLGLPVCWHSENNNLYEMRLCQSTGRECEKQYNVQKVMQPLGKDV